MPRNIDPVLTQTQIDELNINIIQKYLTTQYLGRHLHILKTTPSTNSFALTQSRLAETNGTVVVAEKQTAGKGRLGRNWVSPAYQNIYCSVILKNSSFQRYLTWLPLITGLAIRESLEDYLSIIKKEVTVKILLKWPNDLLIGQKKLGGVLCERISQNSQPIPVIVGFGLNVNSRMEDFPEFLHPLATSLFVETKHKFNRNSLIGHILNNLENWYNQLHENNLTSIIAAYTTACSTIGKEVRVTMVNGNELVGKALRIGINGTLHVSYSQNGKQKTAEIQSADIKHLR